MLTDFLEKNNIRPLNRKCYHLQYERFGKLHSNQRSKWEGFLCCRVHEKIKGESKEQV
jgi:hypothetical protein